MNERQSAFYGVSFFGDISYMLFFKYISAYNFDILWNADSYAYVTQIK